MWGIGCVFVSCCLFVHLGLGEAIERVLHIRCVLFRCVKCLSFWSVLAYSLLIVQLSTEVSVCVAFACSYASLWAELLLGKIALLYEEISNMDAEESSCDSATAGNEEDKTGKGKESPLS